MRLYRQKLGALEADLRSHERRARLAQTERASVGRPSIHLPRAAPRAGGVANQPAVIAILEEGARDEEEAVIIDIHDEAAGAGEQEEAVVILHEEETNGQQDGAVAEEGNWDSQYELDQLTDHEPPATRTSREEGTGEQESGSEAGSVCTHVFILTTRYA